MTLAGTRELRYTCCSYIKKLTPNPMPDDTTQSLNDGENQQLAEQLYNTLMAEIEPDLMLDSIGTLDVKYAGETPEEHGARMKRYEAAYKKFDESFKNFMEEIHEEVRVSKRSALKEQEAADRQSDQPALASLEAAFS